MTNDDVRADVRACAVCGTFYPGDPAELRDSVDGMLKEADAPEGDRIRGIIAPHAGYLYSGPTAAAAYGRLRGTTYDSVIIVSPSHREYFEGVSVYDGVGYATPLGVVSVDREMRNRLLGASREIRRSRAGHQSEHAVEVQLPFLQRVLGRFSFVPLVIGHQAPDTCYALGESIAEAVGERNVLIVASTDLSHYYPAEQAHRLDDVVIADLRAFNEHALMDHLEAGKTEACGGGPAVAALTALRLLGSTRIEIMDYATSGDVTGDFGSVVGYVGAVAL